MSLFGWSYPAGCNGPPEENIAEECPCCGKPNADEEGDPVCAEAPDFCSTACRDAYAAPDFDFDFEEEA